MKPVVSSLSPAEAWDNIRNSSPKLDRGGEESPQVQKLRHGTEEFESMLVSSWWQEMGNTFKDDSESDSDPGADTIQTIGIQSMTLEMAKSGGLGLARMMFHKLESALLRDELGAGQHSRVEKQMVLPGGKTI